MHPPRQPHVAHSPAARILPPTDVQRVFVQPRHVPVPGNLPMPMPRPGQLGLQHVQWRVHATRQRAERSDVPAATAQPGCAGKQRQGLDQRPELVLRGRLRGLAQVRGRCLLACKCRVPVPCCARCVCMSGPGGHVSTHVVCTRPTCTHNAAASHSPTPCGWVSRRYCHLGASFLDCYGRLGCDWCEFDESGEEMPVSQWHCSDTKCPEPSGGPASAASRAVVAPAAVVTTVVAVLAAAFVASRSRHGR